MWGFAPKPQFLFCLNSTSSLTNKKGIKKGQASTHFARETYAWQLKSFKLAFGSDRNDFLTPSSLAFRLIGLGRSSAALNLWVPVEFGQYMGYFTLALQAGRQNF